MSVSFGLNLSAIEETARGIEAPPNSPVSDFERFGAAVAELPTAWHYPYVPYGSDGPDRRVDHAIHDGDIEALRLLLDSGVRPDVSNLRWAIHRGNHAAMNLLFESGLDPNIAAQHRFDVEDIMTYMELFLRHGADIARFTERYGGDIDVLMLKACHDADVDRVGKLIICGASLKHTLVDITWRTQHHAHSAESRAAFLEAQTAIIRLLFEHGTVPADGIADRNALIRVLKEAHPTVACCLLAHGMVKDYGPWGILPDPMLDQVREMLLKQFDSPAVAKDAKLLDECVRAMIILLRCKCGPVRDNCAVALVRWMNRFDCDVPVEIRARVHEALRQFLEVANYPPLEVKHYAVEYNFPEAMELHEEKLLAAGLKVNSPNSRQFVIEGEFEIRKHGLLLVDYARLWMTNPTAPQDHAEAILAQVQASMNDLNDNYPEDFELRLSINTAIEAAREEAAALR